MNEDLSTTQTQEIQSPVQRQEYSTPTVEQTHESKSKKTSAPKKEKGLIRELVEFALIAIVIVIPFRIYIAQPFVVSGLSMDPTFKNNDYLIVDQISYRFTTPARGTILIFKYPLDTSKYFIKRVIGLPGETVKITNGVVTIINSTHPQGFILNEPYIVFTKQDSYETTLGQGEYFVMGDNREGSADSRIWGPVPADDIVGEPIVRLFPISTMGILPGDYEKTFIQ